MASVQEILFKLTGRDDLSPAAKRAAKGLEDLGESADDAKRAAKDLDKQIGDTEKRIGELTQALAKDPGDTGLRKQLRALDRESKALTGLRDRLGKLGDEGAQSFSARFSQRVGPLIASAPISPPLIAAVAAAAPGVSAIISAAVSGGAAVGAVGIGAALASRRTEVAKAWSGLGEEILSGLTVDAQVFAEPLIASSGIVRREFAKLRPEIQGIFADAAQYAEPLARGLSGLGRELAPGLREAVREAEPVVEVLEYQLPRAGRTTSDALKAITEDSGTAAEALSTLMTAADLTVGATGTSFALLNKVLPYTSWFVLKLNQELTESDRAAAEAAAAAEKQAQAEVRRGQAVARSAAEIDGLNRALAEAPGEALSMEQANLRMEQTGRALGEVIKDNSKHISNNRDRLLENKSALLAYAGDVQGAAEATRRQTGSQAAANAVLDTGRTKFLAAAAAAGVEATEAQNLANKLFGIPGKRQTNISVNKAQAEKDLNTLNTKADYAARDRYARIYYQGAISGSLGAIGQRAEGGPVRKGEAYIVGEQRPEVFVPDRDGTIIPSISEFQGGGRGGSTTVAVTVQAGVIGSKAELERWLSGAIDDLRRKGKL